MFARNVSFKIHNLDFLSPSAQHIPKIPQSHIFHDLHTHLRIEIKMSVAKFFTVVAGVLVVASLAVYLFGIPPELKRKLERKALQTMGENKMSYVAKGTPNHDSLQHP